MTESLVGKLMIASTVVPESVFSRAVCLMVHHDENGAIGVLLNRPVAAPPQSLIDWILTPEKLSDESAVSEDETEEEAGSDLDAAAELEADEDPSPTLKKGSQKHPSGHHGSAGAKGSNRLPKVGDKGHDSAGQGPSAKGGQLSKGLSEGSAEGGGMIFGGPVSAADYAGAMVHFGGPLSGPVVALHGSRELAEAEAGAGIYVAAQKKHLEQLVKQQTGNVRLIIGHAAWSSEQLEKEFEAGFWHILPATPEMVLPTEQDLWPLLFRRAAGATVAKWLGTTDTGGNVELN